MKIELDLYHYHEVTDRLYMITDMLDEYVSSHPVMVVNPRLRNKLDKIIQELLTLNGQVSNKSYKYELYLENGGKQRLLSEYIDPDTNESCEVIESKKEKCDVKKQGNGGTTTNTTVKTGKKKSVRIDDEKHPEENAINVI